MRSWVPFICILLAVAIDGSHYHPKSTSAPKTNTRPTTQPSTTRPTTISTTTRTRPTTTSTTTTKPSTTTTTTAQPTTTTTTTTAQPITTTTTTAQPTTTSTTTSPVTTTTTTTTTQPTTTTMTTTLATTTTPVRNCTDIPDVPIEPQDVIITPLVALANENINICLQIIPSLNTFNAQLKLIGVCQQFDQIQMLLKLLHKRIAIIERRLDCGLPASVDDARNLKKMLENDQAIIRVLNGIKMRLEEVKVQLRLID